MNDVVPERMLAWRAENGELVLGETDLPSMPPGFALVQVKATTLNPGEVKYLSWGPPDRVPGLDAAGVVVRPADGIGPGAGARVMVMTGMRGGGWGQYVAAPAADLGIVPDAVGFSEAACIANAGLTALYAVRAGGHLLGARVLVTGATGAVGRYASQLARLSGARVTGTVRSPERISAIAELGLTEVVVGKAPSGPFDVIIDTVGGAALSQALECAAADSIVIALVGGGKPDEWPQPATIPFGWEVIAPGARIESVSVAHNVERGKGAGRDLTLLGELAETELAPSEVGHVVNWREAAAMVTSFTRGEVKGKTVLLLE